MRYPALVRKLVVAAARYRPDGYYSEVIEGIQAVTPDDYAGSVWKEAYDRIAPRPEDWPALSTKVRQYILGFAGWEPDAIRAIAAPTFVMIGDADVVRPEHAVELFRLRGGGVPGDIAGLPPARFAALPGTTHVALMERAEWFVSMVTEFLDAPMPGE